MRILHYDVETLPSVSTHWRFFNENISHNNIIENQVLVSIAWQWSGQNKTYSVSSLDDPETFKENIYNDRHVSDVFHDVLATDKQFVLLGHNLDAFDQKKVNTGFIKHGLTPVQNRQTIDTLKVARRYFKFDSNRLDFLCRFLGIGEKMETGGQQLWNDIVQYKYPEVGKTPDWDKAVAAVKKMVRYNKQDVKLLPPLYNKLKPYMVSHPNHNLYTNVLGCNKCSGKDFRPKGYRLTNNYKYQRYWCNSCNGYFDPPRHLRTYYDMTGNPIGDPHENF